MAYVDLNTIRTKIIGRLETSNNTSIKKRLELIKEKDPIDVQAYLETSITALSNQVKKNSLPRNLKDYVELVEWTGKFNIDPNKSKMPSNIQSSLHRINLQQTHWLKKIENYGKSYCHLVEPIELIKKKARQLKQKWLKGINTAKLLYEDPT
ncbi:MAG: hypothetical protein ACJAS9_001283 [Polaribacter sp.]|jgi:hypothetical protein